MFNKFVYTLLFLGSLLLTSHASEISAPAKIFASGNNKFVLPIFVENFYRKYPGARVVIEYGASGDLANSIMNDVAYDIFLSANMTYPQNIYRAGKAVYPPKEYAKGSLILLIPADNAFSQKKLKVLKNTNIKHITVANKKTAPYGMATLDVLKNSKLWNSVKDKIRYSTDISTVITNVIWYDDAGFLSKSAIHSLPMAYSKKGINWIEVDQNLYNPIIQGYVVSKEGSENINAKRFIEYLLSDEGREIYKQFGYK